MQSAVDHVLISLFLCFGTYKLFHIVTAWLEHRHLKHIHNYTNHTCAKYVFFNVRNNNAYMQMIFNTPTQLFGGYVGTIKLFLIFKHTNKDVITLKNKLYFK